MRSKTTPSTLICVFTISILSVVVMLEEVNAEEEFLTQTTKDFMYNPPTMINNTLLDNIEQISFNSTIQKTDKNTYKVIKDREDSKPSLSVMINNALLGNIENVSFNSTSLEHAKEQFITIKQDAYNENMIFEETDNQVQLLTTKVPFILPVPFP
jgi:hypothetical protein